MTGKWEIETSAAGISSRDGFAIGKPVSGLITSTNCVGSMIGRVGVDSVTVVAGVVLSDGFGGEVASVGRLGLQLLSRKDIKMIQKMGKRLIDRNINDKSDNHTQGDYHLLL